VEAPGKYAVLCISLIFDGFGFGILAMLAESLVALHVNAAERARVMAIQHMVIMAATSPFGYIGGILSNVSRSLPFVLNLGLLVIGFLVTFFYYLKNPYLPAETPAEGEKMDPENEPKG
jgi:MFS family permease